MGFPDKADKEFICNAEDSGSISLGEGMLPTPLFTGFPGGSDGKESTRNMGVLGSILGLGRSLGEGNGYPLQYSCLENSRDRGAWWAIVHGVTRSQIQLNDLKKHSIEPILLVLFIT